MDFLSQTDVLILAFASLILGMGILVKGGDWTVDGAIKIARHYGMPPMLVGFTIVAFGTSLPELIASVNANLKGVPDLAVGNVIGSNIANLLLIGGVSAVIIAIPAQIKSIRNDLIMVSVASIAWIVALLYFPIDMMIGLASLGLLIGYLAFQYHQAQKGEIKPAIIIDDIVTNVDTSDYKKSFILVIAGLIGLALGAELLIRGSMTAARILNVPDGIIGLTIIALGTSLPELTTCVIAALKKEGDVILGNIIGSNVFNLMMILGSMGLVTTYDMKDDEQRSLIIQDGTIMLVVTALFIITLLIFKKIPRLVGGLFACLYFAYMMILTLQSL